MIKTQYMIRRRGMKSFISLARGETFDTFFDKSNIELVKNLGGAVWNEKDTRMTADEVSERIADCQNYVTLWGSPTLDSKILDKAPNLKLLTHLGGTVVPFVSDEMWERGIKVISANDYFAESVAEGTIAYILCALRDIPRYSWELKNEKKWKSESSYTAGLMGKTIGIVSYGTIAKKLVRILSRFKIRIMVYDIKPLPQADVERYGLIQARLEQIFSECDIISLHTPLIDATYHLIGSELLEKIKDGALFVNTSRGAVVDQSALEVELAKGRFRAVLDVYEKEPPQKDCPLFTLPNVIMIPHMAGPTVDMRSYITRELMLEAAGYIDHDKALVHEITKEFALTMSKK
jgi:phosphoglycerate dehydrogenase-like enzyme